ncbi:hypothetical protein TNCV_3699421 [Trichonephila clavipes]|uniref:Uncharacterized protein n=1 Tax=Trichonephila clavipes TaxID=2585209 RepID=A0A8X6SKA8_TRICX|nr:hypothetical protein TNCV_3699421 [Trichonephila clavipes]
MGKDTKINQAKPLSGVNEQQKLRSAMSMLSNQILFLDVKELWSLETIRIRDPVENFKERARGLANDKNRLQYSARPAAIAPAALLEDRVRDVKMFDVTGMDLAGPLFHLNGDVRM